MDSEPARIALVGAGRMGRVHLDALRSSQRVEIGAVVEPYAAARDAVSAVGVPAYEELDQMLSDLTPDGVLIAAPSDQHAALVSRLASATLPVLCEKPLGVRVSEAIEATRAAEAAGIPLQVGYWRRFVPHLRELRELIATGELGEISQIACMQWDAEPPSEAFRMRSGGIAVDMGVHEFDQTRWLLGQEFGWVAAAAAGPATTGLATDADPDSATILSQLSGGAAATISLGRRFPYADSCWIEIWGTNGYARVPFMWDHAGEEVFLNAMISQVEAFADAIRGAPVEGAGGEDAIAALSVAERVTGALASAGSRAPGSVLAAP